MQGEWAAQKVVRQSDVSPYAVYVNRILAEPGDMSSTSLSALEGRPPQAGKSTSQDLAVEGLDSVAVRVPNSTPRDSRRMFSQTGKLMEVRGMKT